MTNKKRIFKFIKSTWTNLNIRCGKYRHLQTKNKCKSYALINIEFTRNEYKAWCLNQEKQILLLKKPSLDRIDSSKNYSLDNIQIIELCENIRKKRMGNDYINGPNSNKKRGIKKIKNKFMARITINYKEIYLGSFNTKDDAYNAFKSAYILYYNKLPW